MELEVQVAQLSGHLVHPDEAFLKYPSTHSEHWSSNEALAELAVQVLQLVSAHLLHSVTPLETTAPVKSGQA